MSITPVRVQVDVQLNDSQSGSFVVEVNPSWAPLGAKRFLDLVDGVGPSGEYRPEISGSVFWKGGRFFRVMDNFMAQFGIAGTPDVSAAWRNAKIQDDPVVKSNIRGYISFATSGKHSRTSQFFINFTDNTYLDSEGFAPFARVIEDGMTVVDQIYKGYGEKPDQGLIQDVGNTYLMTSYPNLSYIKSVLRIESAQETEPNSAGYHTTFNRILFSFCVLHYF